MTTSELPFPKLRDGVCKTVFVRHSPEMNSSHSVRFFVLGFAAERYRSCSQDHLRHPDQTLLSPGYDIGFVRVGKAVYAHRA